MCAFVRFLAIVILLLAAGRSFAQPAGKPAPPELTKGKVLLLDNDRILEGDIELLNGNYRIRRPVGELSIPVGRGKKLCATLRDALDVMKSQANLKDPDERLRLARWCQVNGLKEHALEEAKASLEMRPEHAETLGMVQTLQRFSISSNPSLPHTPPQPPQTPTRFSGGPKSVDVSNEAFALFSTRVQPILMNTCISCHSGGRGGAFQLVRATEAGRAAAQANLSAALEMINVEKPVLSPLLLKSVSAHGGAQLPPLKGRQSAPFQSMQSWVDQLIAGNPHLKEIRQAEIASPPSGAATTSAKKDYFNEVFAPERPALPPTITVPSESKGPAVVSRPLPRIDAPPTATPTPSPPDPFDPAEFNSRPKRP